MLLNSARSFTSGQANRLARAIRSYRAARPITRSRVEIVSCRELVFSGHIELARSLLADLEKFAEDLDSNLVRASAIEVRGLIERQNHNWGQAAIHLWRAVELCTNITGLALSFYSLLIWWHAIVASSLSGNSPPPAALLQPWDTYRELRAREALMRGATATAVALSHQGHRDLAARFVNLSHRNVEPELFAMVTDELDLADLHPDPALPPDSLESLLEELHALDNPTTPIQNQS